MFVPAIPTADTPQLRILLAKFEVLASFFLLKIQLSLFKKGNNVKKEIK